MTRGFTYSTVRHMLCCLVIWLGTAGLSASSFGQVVRPEVFLIQPSKHVAYGMEDLQTGATRVAVVRSTQTSRLSDEKETLINEAVYQWELLLSGLQVSYTVVDDAHLNRPISARIKVLILPAVESLSIRQREQILDYMSRGGSIIASGRTGFYDELGWISEDRFSERAFGLQYSDDVRLQPYGIFQVIETRSALGNGISPGFRLNVSPETPTSAGKVLEADAVCTAARLLCGRAESLGSLVTYRAADQEDFESLTMLASGSNGAGSFLWSMFSPQHVATDGNQQSAYQHLIVNALARMTGARSVSVALWPGGRSMAMTVAALPSPGFDSYSYLSNMRHFIDLLDENGARASVYLASDEISTFPNLYFDAIDAGFEIGTTADNDALIRGLNFQEQSNRLGLALRTLKLSRAHGIYPPGGLIDENSIRAMHALGAVYVIGIDEPVRVPSVVDWWKYADYRDQFRDGFAELSGPAAELDVSFQDLEYPDLSIIPLATSFGTSYKQAYRTYKERGGYLVIPFYPEQYGPFSRASKNLDHVLKRASSDDVWTTTAADALIWWRERASLSVRIISGAQNEMTIEVVNGLDSAVNDVVFDVRLNAETNGPIELVGLSGRVEDTSSISPDATTSQFSNGRTARVRIEELGPGTQRYTLLWSR